MEEELKEILFVYPTVALPVPSKEVLLSTLIDESASTLTAPWIRLFPLTVIWLFLEIVKEADGESCIGIGIGMGIIMHGKTREIE